MRKLFALLLCFTLIIGAFAVPAYAEEPVVYRKLYDAETPSLNYLISSTAVEFRMSANLIDTLIEYDRLGQVQPALAAEWSASDDGLTWTFKLRENASWVNAQGEKVANVTAHDFVAAAKYILDAKNAAPTSWILTDIIAGASEYYDGTATPEEGEEPAPVMDWETVGVKAIDDYTLEYTLTNPAPYFLSMLDYVCFMPVNADFLAEKGENFGVATGNDTILYCGAYVLSTFKSQEKHVYSKNPLYWDAGHVYIDTIDETYNKEAMTLAPELFQRGEIDEAGISNTVAQQWLANPETAELIRPQKQTGQYTYFYAFNYDPQFDAQYEPENWKICVNNENFRKSFYYGLDRVKAMTVHEADNPEALIYKTITPPDIISYNGADYTRMGALAQFADAAAFDSEKALAARDAAIAELTEAGATFPVKVLMCYNPSTVGWAEECQVVEQQLEGLLGTDYIDIIVEAGPASGFLGEIRRSGKYAFMKCNWGLDFADPVNTAEPFRPTDNYCFIRNVEDYRDEEGNFIYHNLIEKAKPIYGDIGERYLAFAEAEAFLIEHALVIPFGSDEGGYYASRVDPFEGQHNACGLAYVRYKGQHLLDKPMSTDMFFDAYDAWLEERAALGN